MAGLAGQLDTRTVVEMRGGATGYSSSDRVSSCPDSSTPRGPRSLSGGGFQNGWSSWTAGHADCGMVLCTECSASPPAVDAVHACQHGVDGAAAVHVHEAALAARHRSPWELIRLPSAECKQAAEGALREEPRPPRHGEQQCAVGADGCVPRLAHPGHVNEALRGEVGVRQDDTEGAASGLASGFG